MNERQHEVFIHLIIISMLAFPSLGYSLGGSQDALGSKHQLQKASRLKFTLTHV